MGVRLTIANVYIAFYRIECCLHHLHSVLAFEASFQNQKMDIHCLFMVIFSWCSEDRRPDAWYDCCLKKGLNDGMDLSNLCGGYHLVLALHYAPTQQRISMANGH